MVFSNASPAVPLDATADPALNPNHPNQRRAAPSITKGKLCGRIATLPNPILLPRMNASAKPAAPALM